MSLFLKLTSILLKWNSTCSCHKNVCQKNISYVSVKKALLRKIRWDEMRRLFNANNSKHKASARDLIKLLIQSSTKSNLKTNQFFADEKNLTLCFCKKSGSRRITTSWPTAPNPITSFQLMTKNSVEQLIRLESVFLAVSVIFCFMG